MRKDNSKIGRCLEFFALQKIGMTPILLSYSGLSRVSRGFKWLLGTSPRMTKERVCAKFLTCIGMTILFCLLSTTAYAECTPTPDCASIGYTETSCDGGFVRCPFDTSKLFCLPCDSSFKYNCNASNQIGVGNTCNGKYASCGCVSGATFNNGSCVCDTSCKTIGNIMYSDNTCSSCMLTDKTAVAVVVYKSEDKHLIAPLTAPVMRWSSSNTDVTSLPNWSSADLAKEDMDGVGNSQLIREFFTSDNGTNNAAWYCYNLEVEGFEDKKGEWYLPSAGEIYNYFYTNYSLINKAFLKLGLTFGKAYWSSSESDPYHAWYVISSSGNMINYSKNGNPSVRCLLVINK